jgi:hypothetical protein
MLSEEKDTEMTGSGYLLRGSEFVSPVDFHLRTGADPDGIPAAEGEMTPKRGKGVGRKGDTFTLHTQAGYSLTVEITGRLAGGRLGFRRVPTPRMAQ